MSYDTSWFRPSGNEPLDQQAKTFEDSAPSPESDQTRSAFAKEFCSVIPGAKMLPFADGFSKGCFFIEGENEDEDNGNLGFIQMHVDTADFSWRGAANFDEQTIQLIENVSTLLFKHGFVAFDPQTNRVCRNTEALMINYQFKKPPRKPGLFDRLLGKSAS
jgi:hypothetical protein